MSGRHSRGHAFPCGLSRREALWEMGGGFAGLALASLLERDRFWVRAAGAAEPMDRVEESPFAPHAPHLPTTVKSCIFLLMNGAPSQVDTFDPKPALEKYAGQPLPPDKEFINSGGRAMGLLTPACRPFERCGESGLPISGFFPHLKQHADKLAVIR